MPGIGCTCGCECGLSVAGRILILILPATPICEYSPAYAIYTTIRYIIFGVCFVACINMHPILVVLILITKHVISRFTAFAYANAEQIQLSPLTRNLAPFGRRTRFVQLCGCGLGLTCVLSICCFSACVINPFRTFYLMQVKANKRNETYNHWTQDISENSLVKVVQTHVDYCLAKRINSDGVNRFSEPNMIIFFANRSQMSCVTCFKLNKYNYKYLHY